MKRMRRLGDSLGRMSLEANVNEVTALVLAGQVKRLVKVTDKVNEEAKRGVLVGATATIQHTNSRMMRSTHMALSRT